MNNDNPKQKTQDNKYSNQSSPKNVNSTTSSMQSDGGRKDSPETDCGSCSTSTKA